MVVVPIPYAVGYTATASGRVCKIVPCESCQTNYFYQMERTAEGAGTSVLFLDNAGAQERAANAAQENVRQALMKEFEIIPCPHCGQYQSYMTPSIRWAHLAWLRVVGVLLFILASIVFGVYLMLSFTSSYTADILQKMRVCLTVSLVIGIPAVAILATKFMLTRRYDPNNEAEREDRIRYAKERCISWEEFEKIMAAALDNAVKQMESSELPEFLRKKKS